MNALGRQPETWDMGGLWLPHTERRLRRISTEPCNNHPLSHWQSLIIHYEEGSSLSTIKSFRFPLLYVFFFPFPLSLLCNLCMLALSPFHSSSVSLAHSPRFGSWVDAYTCVMKAKLIPLFQYDTHRQHSLFVHKLQNSHCEKMLYEWKRYPPRDGGHSKLIVGVGSRCQAVKGSSIPQLCDE